MASRAALGPAPTGRSFNVMLAIIALSIGGFGIGTTEFAVMGLLPDIADGMNVSIPHAGYAVSAYALGVVVGAPVLAFFGARWPRKHLLMTLMVVFALGNFLSSVAPNFGLLIAARFFSGLPHGAFFGVAAVVAASLVEPSKRGQAVAKVMIGLAIANVFGVPFATWVGQAFGWRLAFTIVAAIGLLAVGMIARFVPLQPVERRVGMSRELDILKRGQLWLTLLIGTVGFGGVFAVYSYITPTMTKVAGFGDDAIPFILMAYGLGMVSGNILGGRMADKSVLGSIYFGMIAMTLVLFAFTFAAHNKVTAVIGVYLIGLMCSTIFPAVSMRLMDLAPDGQSLASSMSHSAFNVANALGAWLGGLVISFGWGYTAPAAVGSVLAVLGIGVVWLSTRGDAARLAEDHQAQAHPVIEIAPPATATPGTD
ncbi:MAG TPA: MFS transporter [Thermomicrobiales bacterium]|nr:MFS transporter [Thermomicrobiales bacterium]